MKEARVLASLGEHAAAARHFAKLIAAEENRTPLGSPRLSSYLHSLAGVLLAQGDLAGARARLERALDIQHQVLGTEVHPDVATIYDGLGHCLRDLELFEESEHAFRTALRIRETVFGHRDHYMYAETEFALAMFLFERGQPDEALDMARHAVTVLQAQVPNHWILQQIQGEASQAAASE